jgi:hypothetical protein
MSCKAALASLVLVGFLLIGAAPARADNCSDKIRREEFKLQRDIARRGFFSRQALHRRSRIREMRERCFFDRRHGRWGDSNRWHRHRGWRDRDWDDNGGDRRWERRGHDARWDRRQGNQRWRRWPDRDR